MAMIELAMAYNISFTKIADWTAATRAKRFGLESKGKIQVGMDADFALLSVDENFEVTENFFFAKHKQSLYIGHTFPCKILATTNCGKMVERQWRGSSVRAKTFENKKVMK
jgi:allantoinase